MDNLEFDNSFPVSFLNTKSLCIYIMHIYICSMKAIERPPLSIEEGSKHLSVKIQEL